ncbi:hypothetical protein PIB30_055376 [Stylosanthes scabra]|uniref:Uncharacterized protein n=1 Tax=Stylosanthes scabra TaxID=79078 RepID=A0ABU6RJ92_9FABA|nr:hypothetical protein [Stylosanthes scabra]
MLNETVSKKGKALKQAKTDTKKKSKQKKKVLKELINRYDIYDNTIHPVAREVEITAHKIGNALDLSSTAALSKLIMDTPLDTDENKRLFMRAFVLFIQKCFLMATSSANVTSRALPTIFDVENTKERNWALHVHNFLLEDVKKAKLNNTKAIHGCCYAMLIIYFLETHFEKNAKESQVQPSWIRYWNADTLCERMKQEKCHVAISKSGSEELIKKAKNRFNRKEEAKKSTN